MNTGTKKNWEVQFDELLPLLGHRNWILVVDKAFPLQSAPGMTNIKTEHIMPYTSVFIELDCGYWSAEKEATLRNLMPEDPNC